MLADAVMWLENGEGFRIITSYEAIDVALGFGELDAVLIGHVDFVCELGDPITRCCEFADTLPDHGFLSTERTGEKARS